MTMLNDMRETIGAALKFLGYSINSTAMIRNFESGARRGYRLEKESGQI